VVTAAGDGATAAIRADRYITDRFGTEAQLRKPTDVVVGAVTGAATGE
jgi:hypothetical protein